jgi:hypothetical protein
LDYTAEELTGRNLYSLCHGEDAHKLRKCHVDRELNTKKYLRIKSLSSARGETFMNFNCGVIQFCNQKCTGFFMLLWDASLRVMNPALGERERTKNVSRLRFFLFLRQIMAGWKRFEMLATSPRSGWLVHEVVRCICKQLFRQLPRTSLLH